MHLQRVIVSIILLPLLYLFTVCLPPVWFTLLVLVASFLAQYEFLSMYKRDNYLKFIFPLLSSFFIYLIHLYPQSIHSALPALFTLIVTVRLFGKKTANGALIDISPYWISFFYIPILLGYMIKIREVGPQWVIYLMAVVWGADAFAYYTGKSLGRRSLYREISPNKTLEGAYGAVAGAVLISILLNFLLQLNISIGKIVLVGMVIGLSGIVGDLIESMFKRDADIKDSGSLLPGHGGILDKLDGMLVSTPVLFYLLTVLI